MRARTATGLLLSLVCLPTLASAAHFKVAIVDLQKAINEVNEGKKAKAKLKKEVARKQKALNGRQEELKKLKEEYDAKKLLMKDRARQQMEMELQRRLVELQQSLVENQKTLAAQEARETGKILQKLQAITKKIADSEKFTLVLVNSGDNILYANPSYDITNQVIREYNKSK